MFLQEPQFSPWQQANSWYRLSLQITGAIRVLIHSGAGGVGHLAVQFAKAKGAIVLTTTSGSDLDSVRELGADEVVNYKAERLRAA
jgi:NADPH:quinone reductase-like Zn-dependent oxidoreductase